MHELMQTQKKTLVCIDELGPKTSFSDAQNNVVSQWDQKGPSRTRRLRVEAKTKQNKVIFMNVEASKIVFEYEYD